MVVRKYFLKDFNPLKFVEAHFMAHGGVFLSAECVLEKNWLLDVVFYIHNVKFVNLLFKYFLSIVLSSCSITVIES